MTALPFRYGWVILAAGALGAFMTTPGQTVGVSAFFDPIIADLGISRHAAAAAYAVGTLLGILPAPYIGAWIDRWGVRLAALMICLALVAACVAMALVNSVLGLAAAFAFLRGAAVGGLALLSQHVINLWFVRRRGIAVSAAVGGTALGGIVFPQLIEILLPALGWRMTYVALGAVVALTVLPVSVLLFRGKPESFGLQPDMGMSSDPGIEPAQEPRVTLREAMRTGVFWALTAAGFLSNMIGTALLLHQVSILAGSGIARSAAVALLAPLAAVQALSTPLAGMLIDKYSVRRLLPFGLVVLSAAPLGAAFAGTMLGGWIYAVALGAALGGLNTMQAAGYAEAFGRSNMGAIRGAGFLTSVLGAAVGPLPPVLSLAATGRYDLALWFFAGAALLVAMLSLGVGKRSQGRPAN